MSRYQPGTTILGEIGQIQYYDFWERIHSKNLETSRASKGDCCGQESSVVNIYATIVVVFSAKTEGQFMFFVIFQIENRKLDWNTASKIGSLDNAKHKPGGGQVKVRLRNCSESSKHF